jgi:ABC-2 type transport system permease protein
MSMMYRLTATETRLFLREPAVVFFTIAFAPALLVAVGSLVPGMLEPDVGTAHLRPIDLFLPVVVSLGVALFALTGLPPLLATSRERGVLRRLRITPVGPARLIAAQLLMATILSVATTLALLAIGRVAFGVRLPPQPVAFAVSYLLLALAMFAVGLLVAALAPTSRGATAIGTLAFFPLAYLAGLWVPRRDMDDVLRTISDLTPLGAGVQSLQDAGAGSWPSSLHVTVLLVWAIVAGGVAARTFRWE